jgi:hypothetical protein
LSSTRVSTSATNPTVRRAFRTSPWCTPVRRPAIKQAVGYRVALPHDSRYYLALEMPYDLYLNLIDPPTPLFRVESFRHFREFAACQYVVGGHALLIHCNQGQSRAPMLALLFLAKDLHVLPDDSYAAAVEAFQRASCPI